MKDTSNMSVKNRIQKIVLEGGAALVGVASRERLLDAPESANPDYLLPGMRSAISLAVAMNTSIARDFLSKKDWLTHCGERKQVVQVLYGIYDRLVDFLSGEGYEALGVEINNNYRPEPNATDVTEMTEYVPEFAHRYGALAAGLGRLGWSGNLMTPEHGSMVELGTVLTSAELEPDPLLETNPCDRCKLCTTVCPVEMIGKKVCSASNNGTLVGE